MIQFLQRIINENLNEIKRNQQQIQNDFVKLEITFLLIEIKYSILIDDYSSLSKFIQKLLTKNVNASILELIGMNLFSFHFIKEGIICLKSAISQICKNPEIDGIRLSRLIREIICKMENELNENEICEIIDKVVTILQNTQNIYPLNEIEWLMAWCWNKGNKWRYLHDKDKALSWYGKSLFFIAKLDKKVELKEKLMNEYSAFQAEW